MVFSAHLPYPKICLNLYKIQKNRSRYMVKDFVCVSPQTQLCVSSFQLWEPLFGVRVSVRHSQGGREVLQPSSLFAKCWLTPLANCTSWYLSLPKERNLRNFPRHVLLLKYVITLVHFWNKNYFLYPKNGVSLLNIENLKTFFSLFFMLVLLVEYIYLTTFYGL